MRVMRVLTEDYSNGSNITVQIPDEGQSMTGTLAGNGSKTASAAGVLPTPEALCLAGNFI